VRDLVAKKRLREPDGQLLEDAACLVFLDSEISGFAAGHADYTPEKYVDILRKTMRKMSPAGREAALALQLPEPIAGLVRTAATSLRSEPAP
jgi:tRNAThr (cytosine32-N3)-methyltransferase